ncbi:MAG: coiled-coil domain-containing protein [Promethearchaeota archaeon]
MVFKNILRIKSALPEVKHVAMFYNNGIIFQTTFEQEINIPKLGENLAEILNHSRKLYEICNYNFEDYKKIIFETSDMSIIILKLGEDSNIALFFKKEEEKELKLTAIKRYMTRIEELIDMDERELIIQEIIIKEEEIKHFKELLNEKEKKIEQLGSELDNLEMEKTEDDKKKVAIELNELNLECTNIRQDIEKKSNEIDQLKEKIEKSHRKE